MRFGSSYAILAIRLSLLCSQFSWARNWGKILNPKKLSRQLLIGSVLFLFSCDANYVGYTARHLHQRIAEHKNSAIGRHFLETHGNNNLLKENQFTVLRKCQGKFDCLVFEMLFIKNLQPNLNIQTDSIRAKLFV